MNQTKVNNFHLHGKLIDDPEKDFNEDNQIIVFFKLRTRFNNTYVDIPLILTGENCDSFATLFHKGDQIVVNGMFVQMNRKLHLWVTNYQLVKKNTVSKDIEDRFQKTVELYSIEGIERREKDGKKSK